MSDSRRHSKNEVNHYPTELSAQDAAVTLYRLLDQNKRMRLTETLDYVAEAIQPPSVAQQESYTALAEEYSPFLNIYNKLLEHYPGGQRLSDNFRKLENTAEDRAFAETAMSEILTNITNNIKLDEDHPDQNIIEIQEILEPILVNPEILESMYDEFLAKTLPKNNNVIMVELGKQLSEQVQKTPRAVAQEEYVASKAIPLNLQRYNKMTHFIDTGIIDNAILADHVINRLSADDINIIDSLNDDTFPPDNVIKHFKNANNVFKNINVAILNTMVSDDSYRLFTTKPDVLLQLSKMIRQSQHATRLADKNKHIEILAAFIRNQEDGTIERFIKDFIAQLNSVWKKSATKEEVNSPLLETNSTPTQTPVETPIIQSRPQQKIETQEDAAMPEIPSPKNVYEDIELTVANNKAFRKWRENNPQKDLSDLLYDPDNQELFELTIDPIPTAIQEKNGGSSGHLSLADDLAEETGETDKTDKTHKTDKKFSLLDDIEETDNLDEIDSPTLNTAISTSKDEERTTILNSAASVTPTFQNLQSISRLEKNATHQSSSSSSSDTILPEEVYQQQKERALVIQNRMLEFAMGYMNPGDPLISIGENLTNTIVTVRHPSNPSKEEIQSINNVLKEIEKLGNSSEKQIAIELQKEMKKLTAQTFSSVMQFAGLIVGNHQTDSQSMAKSFIQKITSMSVEGSEAEQTLTRDFVYFIKKAAAGDPQTILKENILHDLPSINLVRLKYSAELIANELLDICRTIRNAAPKIAAIEGFKSTIGAINTLEANESAVQKSLPSFLKKLEETCGLPIKLSSTERGSLEMSPDIKQLRAIIFSQSASSRSNRLFDNNTLEEKRRAALKEYFSSMRPK